MRTWVYSVPLTAPDHFLGDIHIHWRVRVSDRRRRRKKPKNDILCGKSTVLYAVKYSPKPPLRYHLGRASVLGTKGECCSQHSNGLHLAWLATCCIAVFLGYKWLPTGAEAVLDIPYRFSACGLTIMNSPMTSMLFFYYCFQLQHMIELIDTYLEDPRSERGIESVLGI